MMKRRLGKCHGKASLYLSTLNYCVDEQFLNDVPTVGMTSGEITFERLLSESLFSVKEALVISFCSFSSCS